MLSNEDLEFFKMLKHEMKGVPREDWHKIINNKSKENLDITVMYFYWFADYKFSEIASAINQDVSLNNIIQPMEASLKCVKCGHRDMVMCNDRRKLESVNEMNKEYICYSCYLEIDEKPLGVTSRYIEYLKGDHWKIVRTKALEHAGRKCQVCSSTKSLNVHHNNYNNFDKETLQDVVVLCRDCHRLFHGIDTPLKEELWKIR